ncbi:MAG: 3-phosphoshikimate 1-carboxyvinyltransferase [Treponema sp.]|jgi:3-phosphoshikimate 1-carboxyvinyltransferase|nr:3-phosphoshikimate 1-carboxyvinyltransferase [Treponema sp.]
MMITPSRLSGTLDAISSKSFAHRLLICAALADRPTRIGLNGLSDDINATIRCLKAMGCVIETQACALLVQPLGKTRPASVVLDCGESGSTARFLLPLAAHFFDSFTLSGSGRLPGRPFAPLCRALERAGCFFTGDALPLTGTGKIWARDFAIEGDVSSQFISGLLFALPLLDGGSSVKLTTPLQSAAYVDMTIEVLALFGIEIERTGWGFRVKGNQRCVSPGEAQAEGDWSNAAFFLCMGAMGGDVSLRGLSLQSTQGDRGIMDILGRFGANTNSEDSVCTVTAGALRAISIDASQIPDLVPVLAVVASVADGETRIFNAQRLRIKESDRIKSTFDLLSGLGADVRITEDGLAIRGKEKLSGGAVDGSGDHRIVMAAATAACACENPVVIRGCEAVNKSYPSFFEDYRAMGGAADVV